MKRILPLPALFIAGLLGSINVAPAIGADSKAEPLTIVTTIAQVADAVRQVAGERADVTALMGEGVDPHTYRQTRTDIVRLSRADLVFWNGLYLEAQMEDFLRRLAATKPVVALAEELPQERLLSHEDYPGKFDPHVWMDVSLWREVVRQARDALVEYDPDYAATYAANAEAYLTQLEQLEGYVVEVLASVPAPQRAVISAHDAFNYFGEAYDYQVLGIQGLSTESEAGLGEIERLVDFIVENDIQAVFVETSVADRNVQALIEGSAARGHEVTIGGSLFSDAMGKPGSYRGTYLGMIDHNATLIANALGGEAPEAGFQGKLDGES